MDRLAVVHRRLRAQHLDGEPLPSAAEAVSWLGAVQAQEFGEAKWSLAQRLGHPTDAELDRAFNDGEFVRTHAMRPTWHFLAPADIRWILRLTAPRVHAATRSSRRRLELDEKLLGRSAEAIMETLALEEPQTRKELREALARAGIDADASRLGHIMMFAELEGLVCSGPPRGKQQTYVRLEQRVPPGRELEGEEALTELALRYFRSHGPATVRDFAWWSGLKVADARIGLEHSRVHLEETTDEEGVAWYAGPDEEPWARAEGALMLGSFDEAVVAYKDLRTVGADGAHRADLPERTILVGGRAVGTWRRALTADAVTVEAILLGRLGRAERAALEGEVERFGTFLELPARLRTEHGL